jgi:hypothetical protein
VLEQLINIYPKSSLKSYLYDGSLLANKILNVTDIELSLNDVKQIVINNFGHNPLLIYGFHQGNIASPDIRRFAYTGDNVWKTLSENADLFINSNRGTYSRGSSVFNVSYLYEQNKAFFNNADNDLKSHLSKYLVNTYNEKLLVAKKVVPNITNWAYSDLYGSTRVYGGSVSTNSAALMGAFIAGDDNSYVNGGGFDSQIISIAPPQRLSAKHRGDLMEILRSREIRKGTVKVEDLESTVGSEK